MPIGTSNGEYFEDAFDQAHTEMFGAKGTYDPKTDTFVADTEPTPKEIYLVRHGDTDLNKEGEKSSDRAPVRGWSDTPLNEQGRADAQKAADKLSKEPITHIVTSDLPRASETASIIGDKLGITPEEHPGLRTWNLGAYTGKTGKEVHDAVDRLCLNAPDERPPAFVQNLDNPDWYKDPKLDWNTVPMGKRYKFEEVPQKYKNFMDPNYDPKPYIDNVQKQIEKNKLKPGDGFTIHENDGDKTYQYLGPHLPPGQNFFLKPPTSSQEVASSGESFNEFKDRILSTFGEIARDHAEHEVLVVSHNSPERILNAWEEAGQPASREIDRKQYHSDDGSINPGQHKKFTIKDPAQLQQGTGPSFEERWPLPKSLQESLPSPLDVPHGKDEVQGWWKYAPMQTEQQKLDDRRQRQLDMQRELNRSRGFDTIESNDEPPKTSPYPNVRKIAMQGKPYDVIAKQSTQLEGGGTSGRIGATTTGDPILGYAQQGLGVKDIAEKLGLHRNTVNYWLNKLGFPRNQNISKGVDWEKFDTLLKDGKTIAQATQEMGLSQDAYYARQSRLRAQEKKSEPSLPKLDIQKKDLPEQDQDYINELSKWMKNQFEGGPSEPEMVDSMKQYLTDKSTTQFRRAANQNYAPNTPEREEFARNATKDFIKKFNKTAEDVSKMPMEEVNAKRKELAMKQAEKSATAAAAEEFGFKFMQTLKKIASDTKKLNKFSDILKEEVEKAATERRARTAIQRRKDFKVVREKSVGEKVNDFLKDNPDYRQVPWGWTKEDVMKLSHEDYLRGMDEGFPDKPPK